MIASAIFDEFVNFIASKSPKEILAFKSSTKASDRYEYLVHKEKTERLNITEKKELDNYEELEFIMQRVKAKARLILAA